MYLTPSTSRETPRSQDYTQEEIVSFIKECRSNCTAKRKEISLVTEESNDTRAVNPPVMFLRPTNSAERRLTTIVSASAHHQVEHQDYQFMGTERAALLRLCNQKEQMHLQQLQVEADQAVLFLRRRTLISIGNDARMVVTGQLTPNDFREQKRLRQEAVSYFIQESERNLAAARQHRRQEVEHARQLLRHIDEREQRTRSPTAAAKSIKPQRVRSDPVRCLRVSSATLLSVRRKSAVASSSSPWRASHLPSIRPWLPWIGPTPGPTSPAWRVAGGKSDRLNKNV
jgi:hypothetical protein